jgi:hypothetical protein
MKGRLGREARRTESSLNGKEATAMTIKQRLERLERLAAQRRATQHSGEDFFAAIERYTREFERWSAFQRGEGPRPPDPDGSIASSWLWLDHYQDEFRAVLERIALDREIDEVSAEDLAMAGL